MNYAVMEQRRNVYQTLTERTLEKRPLAKDTCTSKDILQWISWK